MNFYRILHNFIILFLLYGGFLAGQNNYSMNLARSLEKSYRYEEALEIYTKLYQQSPAATNVINGIINCYKKLLRYDVLITFLKQNIKDNIQNSGYLWIELGEAYFLNEEKDKALAVWDSIIESRKRDITTFRIIGAKLISLQAYPEAIAFYKKALATNPDQNVIHLEIANLYQVLMQFDLATRYYLAYYHYNKKIKAHVERQILKMVSKTDENELIISEIKQYIAQNPERVEIREMLAGIYLKDKRYDDAMAQYKLLENEHSQGRYYLLFAQEAVKNEAWLIGIETYEELLEKFPESSLINQVKFELAEIYAAVAMGLGEERNESYMQKAITIFEMLCAKTELAVGKNSFIKLGDIYRTYYYDLDNALINYKKFLQLMPAGELSDAVRLLLGETYVLKGELSTAKTIYAAIRHQTYIYTALYLMADLNFYWGNFKESLQSYTKIIQNAGVENDLTNNALQRKLFITSYLSDSLALSTYAKAELFLYRNKWQEAVRFFSELAQGDNILRYKSGLEAGRLYMKHNKFDDARSIFRFVIENDANGIFTEETAYLQACNEEQAGNLRPALELYQDFLVQFPNSIYVNTIRQNARKLNERINNDQI